MVQNQVSLKNTKQDILRAYENLLASKDTSQSVAPKNIDADKKDDFRSKVLTKVDEIEKYISIKKDEAKELISQIEELREQVDLGKKLKFASDELKDVEIKIENETKDWERKKTQLLIETDEDFKWERLKFEKELEQKEWEFTKSLDRKNVELKEKQEKFDEKLKEYELLKKQVVNFPEVLEKVKKEIEIEVSKNLKKEFESEKMFSNQVFESEKKLLQQKITELELRLKEQTLENQNLRSQVSSLQEKFKDVAVAAIKSEISDCTSVTK